MRNPKDNSAMTWQLDGRVVVVRSDPGGTAGGIQGLIFDPRTTSP